MSTNPMVQSPRMPEANRASRPSRPDAAGNAARPPRRPVAAFLAIAFLLVIILPGVWTLLSSQGSDPSVEKRQLAEMPAPFLMLADPASFMGRFDRYFGDNFRPRDQLIRLNTILRLAAFHESPVKGVRLGQGRWLFYSNEWDLEDFENIMPYKEADLERIGRVLEERRAWLAARGIAFVVAVPPNKSDAYSEFLPKAVRRLGAESRLDQVSRYLREKHPDIAFLDLRGPLAEAKLENRTYDYTDTHWNAFGAFAGYEAIMAKVAALRPNVRVLSREEFDARPVEGQGGDLAGMLNLKDRFPEERITMVPRFTPRAHDAVRPYPDPVDHPGREMVVKETGDPSLARALVFRDSFTWQLIPFLSESFQSSVYVWTFDFLPALVEREKPDVVILECVERYLNALLLENPPEVRASNS